MADVFAVLCLDSSKQGLSPNRKLMFSARLAASKPSRCAYLCPAMLRLQAYVAILPFYVCYVCAGGLNSGSHACKASILIH